MPHIRPMLVGLLFGLLIPVSMANAQTKPDSEASLRIAPKHEAAEMGCRVRGNILKDVLEDIQKRLMAITNSAGTDDEHSVAQELTAIAGLVEFYNGILNDGCE